MLMTMRPLLLLALLPLAACATVREGLGRYQQAADKGFEVQVGDTAEPAATPDIGARPNVPAALIGDTENRKYTTDAPATPKP